MAAPIELGSAISPQECILLEDGYAAVDIPLDVVASMVLELLKRDLLSAFATEAILQASAESLCRRDVVGRGPIH